MPRFQNGANHARVTVVNIVCVLCRIFFFICFYKNPLYRLKWDVHKQEREECPL